MAAKIRNLNDLFDVIYDSWERLDRVSVRYLNDSGRAAKEAYRAVIWYSAFHENIESLHSDENFSNLVNISGKHPEYYRVLREVNRNIENSLKI